MIHQGIKPAYSAGCNPVKKSAIDITNHKKGVQGMKYNIMKYTIWVLMFILVGALGSPAAYALERRVGSLEFSSSSGVDPVGMVLLNHIDIKKPSITYQIPGASGGNFTTPWAILIDGGVVIADTLIMLTNPDDTDTLSVNVTLRDKDGVVTGGA